MTALALTTLTAGCPSPAADDGDDDSETETTAGTDTDAGQLPSAPELLSPADGALDVAIETELCWSPSSDPDGDPLGYRVWVDDVELANGETGEYGFTDTCTGSLDFLDDRTYTWRVRAFELDDPARESEDSASWTFTTAWLSGAKPVFFDDFEEDLGWSRDGDALTGDWIRGTPQGVASDGETVQPDACYATSQCAFTGNNPDGIVGEADVDGGSVTLTSPPFDPGDATSLSVSLARFFYRSDLEPTGVSLELELLVPDVDAPDGYVAHVLDKLDGGPTAEAANAWEVVAFAACGVELVPDLRLRITARDLVDPEAVVVEAAIDEVLVQGYIDDDICSPGPGALCDPDDPEPACGPDLLCCAEGPVFDGVYRCAYPAAAIGDDPPAEPGGLLTGAMGCDAPDLEVRDTDLDIYTQSLWVDPGACSLYEGCVDGIGWRRVLRFDTVAANIGSRDLVLGVPANHPDLYTYSPCHEHHHFDNYANYTLLDAEGGDVVATGHKQAFCLLDWDSWAWPELDKDTDGAYTCFNQGLSVGWSDTYESTLDCQWIDVTDVAPGDYTLRVEVNMPPEGQTHSILVERDYANNVIELPVTVD